MKKEKAQKWEQTFPAWIGSPELSISPAAWTGGDCSPQAMGEGDQTKCPKAASHGSPTAGKEAAVTLGKGELDATTFYVMCPTEHWGSGRELHSLKVGITNRLGACATACQKQHSNNRGLYSPHCCWWLQESLGRGQALEATSSPLRTAVGWGEHPRACAHTSTPRPHAAPHHHTGHRGGTGHRICWGGHSTSPNSNPALLVGTEE